MIDKHYFLMISIVLLTLLSACDEEKDTKTDNSVISINNSENTAGSEMSTSTSSELNKDMMISNEAGSQMNIDLNDVSDMFMMEDSAGHMVLDDMGSLSQDAMLSPMYSGSCENTDFVAGDSDSQLGLIETYGTLYQSVGSRNGMTAILLEIHDDREEGNVTPGVYDLAGSTLENCRVCVLACQVVNDSCGTIYMAQEGAIDIMQRGMDVGSPFQFTMNNVLLKEITINETAPRASVVNNGETWCADGVEGNTNLKAQPVEIDQPVRDFQLQNCLTEEFESIHDIVREYKALWMILTSGWCPACRQYIPQAINVVTPEISGDLKQIFIVGEDASYQQPTLEYCRSYASVYGNDGSQFYIDHDGDYPFATTFQNIWPYLGPNGEFGLPWNGIMSGEQRGFTYEYSDGSDRNESVTDVIEQLINL